MPVGPGRGGRAGAAELPITNGLGALHLIYTFAKCSWFGKLRKRVTYKEYRNDPRWRDGLDHDVLSARCRWRKPHPGVCWVLDDRVGTLFVAAIGQLATRFCMGLTPLLRLAHIDSAQMQNRANWNQGLVVRQRVGIDDAGRREQARRQPGLGLACGTESAIGHSDRVFGRDRSVRNRLRCLHQTHSVQY